MRKDANRRWWESMVHRRNMKNDVTLDQIADAVRELGGLSPPLHPSRDGHYYFVAAEGFEAVASALEEKGVELEFDSERGVYVAMRSQGAMRAYMASGPEPEDGAFLVFAPSAREAKKVARQWAPSWLDEVAPHFFDLRIRWLRDADHLLALYSPGCPAVEEPPLCSACKMWGGKPMQGGCSLCLTEDLKC